MMTEPKRRRRKEARPSEIIDAAQAAFVEYGFAATRTDDIAARAGVSKGLIYVYFPTKQALFEAVVRSNVLPIFEVATAALASDQTTPASAQLQLVFELVYRELVCTERRRILHLILSEGPRFPDLAEFYHREVIAKGRSLLRTIVERGVSRGEFKPTGVSRHPEILVAPAIIAALWTLLFAEVEPLDVDAYRDLHLSTILDALKA